MSKVLKASIVRKMTAISSSGATRGSVMRRKTNQREARSIAAASYRRRDRRQAGQRQQHHERRPHPDVGDRHRVQRHVGVRQPVLAIGAQQVVDDAPGRVVEQLPEQADDGHAHHHRQHHHRRQQALAGDRRLSSSAAPKPTTTWPADRDEHVLGGDGEVVPDVLVGEQFAVVLQADEVRRRRSSTRGSR